MDTAKALYKLTKPGIVQGNAVHVTVGALLASRGMLDWESLLGVIAGTSFVIASACVANNYMDRGIDAHMKRTKNRPSVTGKIPFDVAMLYTATLLGVGLAVLYFFTNALVILLGAIAYVTYVFMYGYVKRRSVHSTLVGAIPGALPAMAGYVAISGEVTVGAWLVFLLVFTWQMPHFYAISLFRKDEYRSAKLPVLGAVKSFAFVRWTMFAYIIAYTVVITAMIHTDVVGSSAGLLLLAGAAYWTTVFLTTNSKDQAKWARSVFGASLLLTLGLLAAGVLNFYVPPAL